MACGEPSPCLMKQLQKAICHLCGKTTDNSEQRTNYKKQVDEPHVGSDYLKDPVPRGKALFPIEEPLITHVPTIEYRVTSEVRGKPANIPGLYYIMNHGAMDRSDVEMWIEKKKRMAERNESWPGDDNYVEAHPDMAHFYGRTTHLFARNPEKPYGNSPPPKPPYTQIVPDSRYDEIEAKLKRSKRMNQTPKTGLMQICTQLPAPQQQGSPASDTKTNSKEQSPAKDADNSTTVKSACCPTGNGCPQSVKMMLCLPCPAPDIPSSSQQQNAQKKKPKDYTYRCESRELRGGNLYQCCQCLKRNGLQHDCPRTPCQGRPACLVKPWPDCWPSGGCHGIDYTRENGVKRYDPCSEQRFDKKECRPPGGSGNNGGAKSDCEGNMMIVLCPQQPQS